MCIKLSQTRKVLIDQCIEIIPAFGTPERGLIGEAHPGIKFRGPAVTEQATDGDLEDGGRLGLGGVAVEEPLGGVVGLGFGKTVGVFLSGDLLPVFEVERDFHESCICYL